jgi:hypothetical protein
MTTLASSSPVVSLWTKPNALSISIVSKLRSLHCRVMFSVNQKEWKRVMGSEAGAPWAIFTTSIKPDFVFVCGDFPQSRSTKNSNFRVTEKDVQNWIKQAQKQYGGNVDKLLCIFPFKADYSHIAKSSLNFKTKILFVGEIFGPSVSMETNTGVLAKLINASLGNIKITIAREDAKIYLVYLPDAVEQIIREAFSYWSNNEEALVAQIFTYKEILTTFKDNGRNLIYSQANNYAEHTPPFPIILKSKTPNALEQTISAIPTPHHTPKAPSETKTVVSHKSVIIKKIPLPKVHISKKRFYFGGAAIFAVLMFVAPFILFFIAAACLGVGYKTALRGEFGQASRWVKSSETLSALSQSTLRYFATLPIMGAKFSGFAKNADILFDASILAERALAVGNGAQDLFSHILADEEYDLASSSHDLALNIDSLIKQTAFLEGEVGQASVARQYLPTEDGFEKMKRYFIVANELAQELPSLIAGDQPQTYLLLLQNNTELRPTGGFIGSFALLTFANGHLIDTSVYDVYTADGQLKGHVEPPSPIKNYLGEANWYLRDSNWDPDFPTSATQAEWFLEKELDRKVQGVVSVDLEVAKSLLDVLGPVNLGDFNMVIDSNNMYEKIQHEVEGTFFPGSHKKSTLLTALTKDLLDKLTHTKSGDLLPLARNIVANLDARHIQLAMHNTQLAKALARSGWDGGLKVPACTTQCHDAWVATAEANVGVNKANYYIERSSHLWVTLDNGKVIYKLITNYKNKSTQELALGGRYKAYLRVLALPGSSFGNVVVEGGGKKRSLKPEVSGTKRSVVGGVVFEVPPLSERSVIFQWSTPTQIALTNPGHLSFVWRKQPGTLSDPVVVNFEALGKSIFGSPILTLTPDMALGYNTKLSSDITAEINW